jgi:LAGLIDADG endonuclease
MYSEDKFYAYLRYDTMIENLATVITNLLSAIPWIGQDFVQFNAPSIDIYLCYTLPTIGKVRTKSLRGQKPRSDSNKALLLNIPFDFLAMLVGLIDGDGYISITSSTKGYISLSLVIALEGEDKPILEYIQSVLGIGRINYYSATNTVKYIISRTDLQEVFFPLLFHHGIFFLTTTRRAQFNLAMHVLQQDLLMFSEISTSVNIPNLFPFPTSSLDLSLLPFFNNWIVGFTIAEGSFYIKSQGSYHFNIPQRGGDNHLVLFDAFNLAFGTSKNVKAEEYITFHLSTIKELEAAVRFFSFSGLHPLLGLKLFKYQKWVESIRNSSGQLSKINLPTL